MKQISIDQDVFDFLTSKANVPDEPPSAVLRRELRVPPTQKLLDIDEDTYAFVAARTAVIGESVSDILRRELHLPGGASTPPP
jgi:negative regulator of replication initiation